MGEVEVPVGVGCPDDPVAAPRNDEQDAGVRAADQPDPGVDPVPRHDQVNALGGAHPDLTTTADHLLDLVGPDPGRVDGLLGPDLDLAALLQVAHYRPGDAVALAQESSDAGAVDADGAVSLRRSGDHHCVPGVVDLAVVVADSRRPVRPWPGQGNSSCAPRRVRCLCVGTPCRPPSMS